MYVFVRVYVCVCMLVVQHLVELLRCSVCRGTSVFYIFIGFCVCVCVYVCECVYMCAHAISIYLLNCLFNLKEFI